MRQIRTVQTKCTAMTVHKKLNLTQMKPSQFLCQGMSTVCAMSGIRAGTVANWVERTAKSPGQVLGSDGDEVLRRAHNLLQTRRRRQL